MSDDLSQQVQIRTILNVIFKRKNQILVTLGVTIVIVVAITFLTQPLYEASAQILVTFGRGSVLFPNPGEPAPNIFLDQEHVINSEIGILKSSSLAEKTIREMGGVEAVFPEIAMRTDSHAEKDQIPMRKALLEFQKAVSIKPGKKSNLITIDFRHPDPQMAAEIVNRLSANFLDYHSDLRKTRKSYEFFQNQTKILEDRLYASEKELEFMREKYQISNFEEQKSILLRQKAELQSSLNQATSLETEASNRIAELRKKLQTTPENVAQQKLDDPNNVLISSLQSRLVDLELQEKSLSNKYTDENRSLRSIREEIDLVRRSLSESENKTWGRRISGTNPVHQLIQQELIRYETEKKALEAKREVLNRQIAECDARLADLNQIELKFNQLKQQTQSDRKNYDLYLIKLEESRISDAMDAEKISNLSLVDAASVPLKPVSPKITLNLVMGILTGLFTGVSLAFVSEYMRDRLESPEDIDRVLRLPVLASIPELRKAS